MRYNRCMSDATLPDTLTPAARDVLRHQPKEAYLAIVPDAPDASAKPLLEKLNDGGAVPEAKDADAEACCRSALWLWHDFLDESHTISQSVETPEGSYWHGIMHRREGDFSNAKYWFRRAGTLPVFQAIASQAAAAVRDEPIDRRMLAMTTGNWDPAAFVDLCQEAHKGGDVSLVRSCVAIQQAEWRTVFDHCVRLAAGA